MVRAAMDGLEVMGRKLRAEFKKQLRPGEKEMIERTKAIKRMRSAQMLATNGSGVDSGSGAGQGGQSWPRRAPSGTGRWSSTSDTSAAMDDRTTPMYRAQPVPPVPPIPSSFLQSQYSFGPGPGPHGFQQHHPQQPYTAGGSGGGGTIPGPSTAITEVSGSYTLHTHSSGPRNRANFPSTTSSSSSDSELRHPGHSSSATGADADGASSSVVSVSDVGTSVSQRAAWVSASEEEEEGSEIGDSNDGTGEWTGPYVRPCGPDQSQIILCP